MLWSSWHARVFGVGVVKIATGKGLRLSFYKKNATYDWSFDQATTRHLVYVPTRVPRRSALDRDSHLEHVCCACTHTHTHTVERLHWRVPRVMQRSSRHFGGKAEKRARTCRSKAPTNVPKRSVYERAEEKRLRTCRNEALTSPKSVNRAQTHTTVPKRPIVYSTNAQPRTAMSKRPKPRHSPKHKVMNG